MLKNAKKLICFLLILFMAVASSFTYSQAAMTTPKQVIIINTRTNRLGYYKSGKLVKEFRVATGKASTPTPTGKTKVVNKIKNRPYYAGGIAGGAPNNPLGKRWIGLHLGGTYGTTYGIHGNIDASSIGKHVSGGCIRMHNDEVEWLFDQINIGATVLIAKSYKSYVEIAKDNNIKLYESSNAFQSLTSDIYKYDAGSRKYLTYINGKGYSQYSYVNKAGTYAFTPSSWMKAAGLDVTMPTYSNGYKMSVSNPYIKLSTNLNNVLTKAKNGQLTSAQIKSELNKVKKVSYSDNSNTAKVSYKKTLVSDLYKYNAGSKSYLTNINSKGYSQFTYLNRSEKYAFTPSSWMKAAGLEVSMPSSSNGYVMKINNPYIKKYNSIIEELKTYL